MSFYSVTNPTTFSVVSDTRKQLVNPGKLTRFPATQQFSSAATLTAEQLIAGNIIGDTSSAGFQLTLPSATDLITLLMGPGGFDVSSNDIFTFRIFNTNGGANNVVVKINASTGEANTGSDITIAPGANKPVNIQITVSGSSYSYAMF